MNHWQCAGQLPVQVRGIVTGNLHRALTLDNAAGQHLVVVELVVVEEVTIVGVVVATVVVGNGGWLQLTEASFTGRGFSRCGDHRVH